jgi:lysophospholipase L1-like esterase
MKHVILLGDSIFDNQAYVGHDPDVQMQLRRRLAPDWKVTLLAVDGDKVHDVEHQLKRLPQDAAYLVVSAGGGNNALGEIGMMQRSVSSVGEALNLQAAVAADFEKEYRAMIRALQATNLPFVLSTIYYPNYPDVLMNRLGITGLTIFNDCIIRLAVEVGAPLIDLRLVCNEPSDYANPIEPSAKGGEKITAVVQHVLAEHNFSRYRTEIFF